MIVANRKLPPCSATTAIHLAVPPMNAFSFFQKSIQLTRIWKECGQGRNSITAENVVSYLCHLLATVKDM